MRWDTPLRFLSMSAGTIYFFLLTLATTVACQRHTPAPADAAESGPTYESFDLSLHQCEKRIRQKMITRDLRFKATGPLRSALEKANHKLPPALPTRFAVRETKQIHALSVEHHQDEVGGLTRLIYKLSLGDCSEHPLTLTLEHRQTTRKSDASLIQQFWLDETCEPHLHESLTKNIRQETAEHWSYVETNYRSDGSSGTKDSTFDTKLPLMNLDIYNNLDDPFTEIAPPLEAALFLPELGVTNAHYRGGQTMRFRKFDLNLELAGGNFILDRAGHAIESNYIGRDPVHHVIMSESRHRRTYYVSREIFDLVELGSAIDANEFVTMRLGEGYLEQSAKVRLTAAHEPAYDHLAAYWQVRDRVRDPATGLIRLSLVANAQGTIKGDPTPDDLRSNATIQTDHPVIRAAAQEIRAAIPLNRKSQLGLVLNFLNEHYGFDYRQSLRNTVRAVTTTEALARGRGVCQHYAVLFTSLARALGIPTRIVSGYHLHDTSADDYAWVEAEITPGEFQVIDPTGPTLKDTEPRYYFPIERARELEDKDAPVHLETTLAPQDYSLTFDRISF